MVAENFAPALACVLVHEGGKDDDPRDPGGRTAYGVIQRRYDQYRKSKGLSKADVWDITPAERTEIYKTLYWDVIRGDDLPAGTDYAVFDGCVNSGDGQVGKWLQRAINDVRATLGQGPITVDGRIGEGTLQALATIEDQDKVIALMQAKRLAMLQNLKTWPVFGKGWARRVRDVQVLAQSVARGSVFGTPPAGWVAAPGKALITDAKPLPSPNKGLVASTVGTVTAGTSAIVPTLAPAQGINSHLDMVIQGLMIVGALAAAIGAAWAVYANKRAAAMSVDLDLSIPQAATS